MSFYAHRHEGKYHLLSTHLAYVAAGAAGRLAGLPQGPELAPAALLAGLCHDFGKYTSFFQRYLRTGRGGPEKQHAFISGLWAAHLAERLELAPPRRVALFLTIVRHHQCLTDPRTQLVAPRDLAEGWDDLAPLANERLRTVSAQVADIQGHAPAVARSLDVAARRSAVLLVKEGLPAPSWLDQDWAPLLGGFLEDWTATYGELYRAWRPLQRQAGTDLALYFEVLSLFSSLIDADKIHAARVAEGKRPSIPADAVARFRSSSFGPPRNAMDTLRDDLYRSVVEQVSQAPRTQRLFTITAPTGSGKTMAALAAAFCLRERRAVDGGPRARIIYALPFTSIVDQTFDVTEAVLRTDAADTGEVPSTWLLKHHHLAEPIYRDPGRAEDERPLDASLLLIESWQSEVVVTTFVQLFHTLVGYENRMLKKFHRLSGAVLILDEVQSIPVEYWPLVTAVLRQAAVRLDLQIILMTATRPEWFDPDEAVELGGDRAGVRSRFAALNRVTVTADTMPLTVAQAAEQFLERRQEGRAYLVVLNTIKSSIAFYQSLREVWDNQRLPLFYLSTNIVPIERERRLRLIRDSLQRGQKPVVVSTQVVEAGVDLDFDEVWRDLGPLDAVVQVAGRCNRHLERVGGRVRLLRLVDDGGAQKRLLASYVYGPIHTHAASSLFTQRPTITEPDFFDAVADYFRLIREAKSTASSEDILQAMAALRFTRTTDEQLSAVADFALIKELPNYVDVFICTDKDAADTWERYRNEVVEERDLRRRAAAFLALKSRFRRYVLSVPRQLLIHRLSSELRPLCVPPELLGDFYDHETGFKRAAESGALIW